MKKKLNSFYSRDFAPEKVLNLCFQTIYFSIPPSAGHPIAAAFLGFLRVAFAFISKWYSWRGFHNTASFILKAAQNKPIEARALERHQCPAILSNLAPPFWGGHKKYSCRKSSKCPLPPLSSDHISATHARPLRPAESLAAVPSSRYLPFVRLRAPGPDRPAGET